MQNGYHHGLLAQQNTNPDSVEQIQPNDEMKQTYLGLRVMMSWSCSITNVMTREAIFSNIRIPNGFDARIQVSLQQ